MNKIGFLFVSSLFLVLAFFAGVGKVDLNTQATVSLVLIGLLGIPHGAIDHVLYMEQERVGPLEFYGFYLGLMGLYIVAWIYFPLWSLAFFLLNSAFHFGQSQFSDVEGIKKWLSIPLHLLWGVSILSGMVWYNREEVFEIARLFPELNPVMDLFYMPVYSWLLPVSTVLVLGILVYALITGKLRSERFFIEIYVLALIHFCFMALPLMIGFTLYFIILHALKVMVEEFVYLKNRRANFSIGAFFQMVLPFTLLSLFGSAFLIVISRNLGFIHSVPSGILVFFILISILTLPHSIVMDGFYRRFQIK